MTFVFRTSSFFVVFVITLKATTFVVGNTADGNSAADRFNYQVERLVDEAVRFRGEAREASDHVVDMAVALHVLGDRMIERTLVSVRAVAGRTRSVLRQVARFARANTGTATSVLHNFRRGTHQIRGRTLQGAMPIKEVKRGGYIAIG